jgi:hypothetical protein
MIGAFSKVLIERPKLPIVLKRDKSLYSSSGVTPYLIKLTFNQIGEP